MKQLEKQLDLQKVACVDIFLPSLFSEVDDEEDYEDQWLGVTVRSQGRGKKVMVCNLKWIVSTS